MINKEKEELDQLLDQFRYMVGDEIEESWQGEETLDKRIRDCQDNILQGIMEWHQAKVQEAVEKIKKLKSFTIKESQYKSHIYGDEFVGEKETVYLKRDDVLLSLTSQEEKK